MNQILSYHLIFSLRSAIYLASIPKLRKLSLLYGMKISKLRTQFSLLTQLSNRIDILIFVLLF